MVLSALYADRITDELNIYIAEVKFDKRNRNYAENHKYATEFS